WSGVSSSTSTLPPLDQELTELLERHRRLDKEAALLTRQAEADARRWDGSNTLSSSSSPSSGARRPASPPPGQHASSSAAATGSYGSRYGDSSSATTADGRKDIGVVTQDYAPEGAADGGGSNRRHLTGTTQVPSGDAGGAWQGGHRGNGSRDSSGGAAGGFST
ncbi:unnamed protein product, partial [Scytosiphon promiscuus]